MGILEEEHNPGTDENFEMLLLLHADVQIKRNRYWDPIEDIRHKVKNSWACADLTA